MMNYEWRKAIDAMRKDGYAVIIYEPEEFNDVATATEVEAWAVDCVSDCLEIRREDND